MPPLRDVGAAAKLPVNIVILGTASVGKTALTLQFINEKKVEPESCQPTLETSFYKDLKLHDLCSSVESDSVFGDDPIPSGVECLWKMDDDTLEQKRSSSLILQKQKHKGSNNNVCEQEVFKTVLKITDTASYKVAYNSRKSLRERLALKLTPRRKAPVSSPDGPVRRRYLRNTDSSPKSMNGVPSFIYRKTEGKSTMHDSVISSADAFILVYSVQDKKSFEALQKIRSHIHAVRGCPCAAGETRLQDTRESSGRNRLGSTLAGGRLGSCVEMPSIAVVGTHIDLTAPVVTPCTEEPEDYRAASNESLFNYAFSFTPKRRGESQRRIYQKQVSLTAEILAQTNKPRPPEVTSEHVRGVVGVWSECVGYAEVSNNNVSRVRRIFEHLATQVVRNRIAPSPRKRMDSVLSVFSRKSDSENSTSCSCWPF